MSAMFRVFMEKISEDQVSERRPKYPVMQGTKIRGVVEDNTSETN